LIPQGNITIRFIHSLHQVAASAWNGLVGDGYPFLRHEFLLALEDSGCTTHKTGWQPLHALIESANAALLGVLPLYLKTNSMGEYVFDWGWADAYQRHGLHYYPKLLSAIPFTPCAGPRLCLATGVDFTKALHALQGAIEELSISQQLSGWHVLFPEEVLRDQLLNHGHLLRTGCQYQWFNQGYESFDDYLATFASRKRKNLRKERSAVADAGITMQVVEGNAVTSEQWALFYQFYASTYVVRGRQPYLNADFFLQLAQVMPGRLMLVLAMRGQDAIAGALFFKGADTLYGRYWGCREEVAFLHFEACYYQGIEYCIRHRLQRMDSGAQGEHKIQRGFAPVSTWSTHWIRHSEFRQAIANFVEEEQRHISSYMQQAAEALPFKKDS
jgi:uncharacterized protein